MIYRPVFILVWSAVARHRVAPRASARVFRAAESAQLCFTKFEWQIRS